MVLSLAAGIGLYLLACAFFYLSGRALLRALLAPPPGDASHLLAPVASLALHIIALEAAVASGLTTKTVARIGWPVGLVLALLGVRDVIRERDRRWLRDAFVVLAVGAVPVCGAFVFGMLDFPGSPAWDGWSYVAFAQYLHDQPIGADGGLAPLYQYAAHLAGTRFVAPALIGYLAAPLIRSGVAQDVQQGVNLFLSVVAFTYAAACAWHWRTHRAGERGAFWYALLATSSYWVLRLLVANNYDHFAFLAILPAMAGARFLGRENGYRLAALLGALMAAELFVYPELSPVAGLVAAAGVAVALRDPDAGVRRVVRESSVAALVCVALCAPFAARLARFFGTQLGSAMLPGARQGEGTFPELLVWREFPINLLGFRVPPLGGPAVTTLATGVLLAAALGMAVLVVAAIVRSARRRQDLHLIVVLLAMIAGHIYFLWRRHYDYGAYKLAVSCWWLLAFFLYAGIRSAPELRVGDRRGVSLGVAALGVLLFAYGGTTIGYYWYLDRLGYRSLAEFRAVRDGLTIAPTRTIFDGVSDDRPSMWMAYFLRDRPVVMLNVGGSMAQEHLRPFMARSAPEWRIPAPGDLILVDAAAVQAGAGAVWRTRSVAAVELAQDRPVILGISGGAGQEWRDGRPLTWIGRRPAALRIVSARDRQEVLVADVVPGAGASSPQPLTVVAAGVARAVQVPSDGAHLEVDVSLHSGVNEIALLAPAAGAQGVASEGSPLKLLAVRCAASGARAAR